MVHLRFIEIPTRGRNDIIDITVQVQEIVSASPLHDGNATIFVPGSTGALSTIEYEPGLIADLPALLERLIPQAQEYRHDQTWHDGNGHAHLRATLIGPTLTVPFAEGQLLLGTWQQVVFLEFDNKPRQRRLAVQLLGE